MELRPAVKLGTPRESIFFTLQSLLSFISESWSAYVPSIFSKNKIRGALSTKGGAANNFLGSTRPCRAQVQGVVGLQGVKDDGAPRGPGICDVVSLRRAAQRKHGCSLQFLFVLFLNKLHTLRSDFRDTGPGRKYSAEQPH